MPEFRDREAARAARKAEALAPYVAAALARQKRMKELGDGEISAYPAYGLTVAEVDVATLPEANRRRTLLFRKMREIAERS